MRELNSQEPLPDAPGIFQQSNGARYPLVYHYHRVKRPDGLDANHSLFWSFSPNYELVGPRDYKHPVAPIAVDRFGRSFALGSTGEKLGSGRFRWRELLLEQRDEGVFADVDPALQVRIAEPQLVVWSDILDGFVLSSVEWREDPKIAKGPALVGDDMIFVLRDNTPVSVPDVSLYLKVATDLPSLGVTALVGSRSLVIVTPRLEAIEVARVNPGRHGFEALYETRDQGWIYVAGNPYDNAIHLEQRDGKWRATSIVRIAKNNGRLGAILRWLFGTPQADLTPDSLSKIIHAGWCRRFSATVKRMIFCEEMDELRQGELVPIAGGKVALRTFVGDASSVGLALFIGADGHLYGYDGEQLRQISNGTFDSALVRDLPKIGRTFVTTPSALFEVRRKNRDPELVKLIAPPRPGFFGTDFYAAPDGATALAFLSDGIYQLVDDTLTLVWPSVDDRLIDTSGTMTPTDVIGWKGILFTTSDGRNEPQFHLLRACSGSAQ